MKYALDWNDFDQLAQIIVNNIISNNLHLKKICLLGTAICLLGTARGALPLLTYVSHQTGIRDISVIQLKMTNSDQPFDYGDVSILLKAIRYEFNEFILLEDIVCIKDTTIQRIQRELQKNNKKILDIYSLVIDEAYHNKSINIKVKPLLFLKRINGSSFHGKSYRIHNLSSSCFLLEQHIS